MAAPDLARGFAEPLRADDQPRERVVGRAALAVFADIAPEAEGHAPFLKLAAPPPFEAERLARTPGHRPGRSRTPADIERPATVVAKGDPLGQNAGFRVQRQLKISGQAGNLVGELEDEAVLGLLNACQPKVRDAVQSVARALDRRLAEEPQS